MKSYGLTIQMKPLLQYFHMVLFIYSVKFQLLIPYIALTFSVDELLWCDHSNETFLAVVSHDTIYLLCSTSF